MRNEVIKRIASNAIVAALYFVLTVATSAFSYGAIQVRIAEALVLLCFFRKDYIIGVTLGCLLANLFSTMPMPILDMVFGTLATLISSVAIAFMRKLFIATIFPVLVNAFVVGAELYFMLQEPFWLSCLTVGIGEFIAVSVLGYTLFMILGRQDAILKVIGAKQNLEFKW